MEDVRIPPQNIELEASLLSSLIYSGDTESLDLLKPEHFYRLAHQKIFKACRDVFQKEQSLDIKLVAAEMGNDLEAAGGVSYLAKLYDEIPASNTETYCRKLISLANLRRMIELANAVTKRAFTATPDEAQEVLDYAANELARIVDGRPSSWCAMKDLVVECMDHCEEISKSNGLTGVPSGFSKLDFYTAGFQPGDLIVLAARPGCGKTAFAVNAAKNSARAGHKNLIQSLEMERVSIGNRFLAVMSRVNSLKFRSGRFGMDDWERLTDAAGALAELPIWVDDSPRVTVQEIQKSARAMRIKNGLDILWIDYLGFVDGDKSSRSKVQEIESITRALKALGKELCIPVVLISQLNRDCERRDNKRPVLSDLRDSGALEQDADVVLFLYRDSKYNKDTEDKGIVECEIAKQRNGPEARVKLRWAEEYTRFDNLEESHERAAGTDRG